MLAKDRKLVKSVETEGSCDVRVWSGACHHATSDDSEKYLCSACEAIAGLDHEVRHEIFPHVSGDYDRMM